MKLTVTTPDEYVGDIQGDINKRRGMIVNVAGEMNAQDITSMVPLANLFGYITVLRTISQGRAYSTMEFDHFEPLPEGLAKEVIEKRNAAKSGKK